MLNLFKKKREKALLFIVEDNEMYLHQLKFYLENKFKDKIEIKSFKVAEIAMIELDMKPDLIIMDHFLDSKYEDASEGLIALKEIHEKDPSIKLVLHSSKADFSFAVETIKLGICQFIPKNHSGLEGIADVVRQIIEK